MKKILFNFILYIVCGFFIFKPAFAEIGSVSSDPNSIILQKVDINTQQISPDTTPNPLSKINNNISTLFILPFIVDKLYPDEKIKEDITPFLQSIYPKVETSTLETLGEIYKYAISLKRRYTYFINKLTKQVRADNMLPKDAPIIAKDGEFAIFDRNQTKQSAPNQYQVKYEPYKYLDYDKGEYGEPVRRRDKNYEEDYFNFNEVMLALLKFDIPGFIKAINKTPKPNDGSREKANELGEGIRSRILLDTSSLGDAEKINAIVEIYVPQGQYINGDYLNPQTRPQFILSESPNEELNIKHYELHYPEALGIIKDGQAKRILVDHIRYPLTIHRSDINKGIKIKGTFTFQACTTEGNCRQVLSNHEISLPASDEYKTSLHDNYVTQGHLHVPQNRSKNAQLESVKYNKQKNLLTIKFQTRKHFNNVAVMVEDAVGTNFINPQYTINDNNVIATFEATQSQTSLNSQSSFLNGGEIAITASFGRKERLRTTSYANEQHIPSSANLIYLLAFAFGLLLNIMPGIMNVITKLTSRIWEEPKHLMVYLRYCLSSLIAWYTFGIIFSKQSWNTIFINPILTTASILIITSFILENLNYMDYSLFRPFKRFFKKGYINGFFSVILIAGFPMLLAPETLSQIITPHGTNYQALLFIWLGQITIPFLLLTCRNKLSRPLEGLKYFNLCYNCLYIVVALWLTYANKGILALLTIIIAIGLTSFFWYIYPIAITETIRHTRSKKRQQELFLQVQKHILLAITTIYITATSINWLIPIKTTPTISVNEAISEAQKLNQNNTPLLVTITSNWSYTKLTNLSKLHLLKQQGMQIIKFNHTGNSEVINNWLQTYHQTTTPLNVLYTKRHPKGLVLPANLTQINWQEATATFN